MTSGQKSVALGVELRLWGGGGGGGGGFPC